MHSLLHVLVWLTVASVSRALMTKTNALGHLEAESHSRHCSLHQPHARIDPSSKYGSALALEGKEAKHTARYTYDACNSVRVKDVSLVKIKVPSVIRQDPCALFASASACAWTANYSCPGQGAGIHGEAVAQTNMGYQCCCTNELWRNLVTPAATATATAAAPTEVLTASPIQPVANTTAISAEGTSSKQQVVWVSGYPRSGSSTMLSMVSAASGHVDARLPGETFSLFEPCHNGDEVDALLEVTGCMGLLESIANCQFAGVKNLWGWPDPHSTNNKTTYDSESATALCKDSDVIAFKTVDFAHDLTRYIDMVDNDSRLKIIDIVRDPRGIWSSYKTTEPFATLITQGSFYTLAEICETFASNLDLNRSNIYHVVFEELVLSPVSTTEKVYDFLGLPFDEPQRAWVDRTFDAKECPPPPPGIPKEFTDCHQDSTKNAEKWRTVLSADEIAAFNASPSCQKVVKAYGFPAA